jgi:signal transduction histidine kinase
LPSSTGNCVKLKEPSEGSGDREGRLRELEVAQEIAQAFLTARLPIEVYRLALERVAPLVGASFGCVYLRDDGGDLLRLIAAYNWPQAHASYLGAVRVKVGNGPTGTAVADNKLVEVRDVFADESVADWWEAARELGFSSSVSVPLAFQDRPVGAITFYFKRPEPLSAADRGLLRLVGDLLSGVAEKAHLIEDLQKSNELLRDQNVELEARYREAEEARRLKNEFLANVSHELRTPLTAILGYAYLLREGLSGPLGAEQNDAVAKIERAGGTLMGMINDLLDLSHLMLRRTTVEREPCDAVALLRAALAAVMNDGATSEVRLEVPRHQVPIHTDPVLVVRILQKLISNALKFTPDGTVTLRVHASRADRDGEPGAASPYPMDCVFWEIEDTGIGISPDHQRAIFDEFRQVDGSATRRFSGSGIGLAISRRMAERLGGTILVSSRPGQGSLFTLALPASNAEADLISSEAPSSTSGLATAS